MKISSAAGEDRVVMTLNMTIAEANDMLYTFKYGRDEACAESQYLVADEAFEHLEGLLDFNSKGVNPSEE